MNENKEPKVMSSCAQNARIPSHTSAIPQEVAEKASEIIEQAFDVFKDHLKSLMEAGQDLEKTKDAVEKRIKRGARRTNGRIV